MMDEAEQRLSDKRMVEVAVIDVDTAEEGDAVTERLDVSRVYRSPVSLVVGAHPGPGSVRFVFYAER